MTSFNNIGINIIYPPGCKEIQDGLRTEELKRRLSELMRALEEMIPESQESMLNETANDSVDNLLLQDSRKPLDDYRGLAYLLRSEMLLEHEDKDVQIKTAVCLCFIVRYFCPNNVFESFSDFKTIVKVVLNFLLKCIEELSKCKTKNDKYYTNLFKILMTCCQIDVFHWYTVLPEEESEQLLIECFRVLLSVVRREPTEDSGTSPVKTVTDTLAGLLGSCDASVLLPDRVVTMLLDVLVDQSASKQQRQVVTDLISRCASKLEDGIQSVLQAFLLQDDQSGTTGCPPGNDQHESDSSGDERNEDEDDEACSLDSHRRKRKAALRADKVINQSVSVIARPQHSFQLVYELYKVNVAVVAPVLPMLDVKLRSQSATDRKRACRLIGKLFATGGLNQGTGALRALWEALLGRFLDIEPAVRQVCVRVARDLLLALIPEAENEAARMELAAALEKRSHDQEDDIRLQVVLAASEVLAAPGGPLADPAQEPRPPTELLLAALTDRARDRHLETRRAAYSFLARIYHRAVLSPPTAPIPQLLPVHGLARARTALNKILRLYQRHDIHDRIIVERLFNTHLVPYQLPVSARVSALAQAYSLADEPLLSSLQEMLKTQRLLHQALLHATSQLVFSLQESPLSKETSAKLHEAIRQISEYLPQKDRLEMMTKLFTMVRHDRRLRDQFKQFLSPDSNRQTVVKSISEIKRIVSSTDLTVAAAAGGAAATSASACGMGSAKKKALVAATKCLLERAAPIIIDRELCQEMIAYLVSALDLPTAVPAGPTGIGLTLPRALAMLQALLVIYKPVVPLPDAYEYLVAVMRQFERQKVVEARAVMSEEASSTPGSIVTAKAVFCAGDVKLQFTPTVEELALAIFTRIVGEPVASNTEEAKKQPQQQDSSASGGALLEDSMGNNSAGLSLSVLPYLDNCMNRGGCAPCITVTAIDHAEPQTEQVHQPPLEPEVPDSVSSKFCRWRYDCRIAKLATRCLLGLHSATKEAVQRSTPAASSGDEEHQDELLTELTTQLEAAFSAIIKKTIDEEGYNESPVLLTSLSQIGLYLSEQYGTRISAFVESVVLPMMEASQAPPEEGADTNEEAQPNHNIETGPLIWVEDEQLPLDTQVKTQALKLLGRWLPSLSVQREADRGLVVAAMARLQQLITVATDAPASARLRLAAGECWLRLAQHQAFLALLDIGGLYRLPLLLSHPLPLPLRLAFLRKLNRGLCRLRLPLDYMALLALAPLLCSAGNDDEFLGAARKSLLANIARRRDFLTGHQHYTRDAKLLFAVLPEYVLAFVIHMLAHQPRCWPDGSAATDESMLELVKRCLWFVMEPLVKNGDNYSFIRKLLERIKHAVDATRPAEANQPDAEYSRRLHTAADIALGLLLCRQSTPQLREYPVELRLPRTRYLPAPSDFCNPDFLDLLPVASGGGVAVARLQFTPPPARKRSASLAISQMPPELLKGHQQPQQQQAHKTVAITLANTAGSAILAIPQQQSDDDLSSSAIRKPRSKVKITIPDFAAEEMPPPPATVATRVTTQPPQVRDQHQLDEEIEFSALLGSHLEEEEAVVAISRRGRVCKPNKTAMRDMVSPVKLTGAAVTEEPSPRKKTQASKARGPRQLRTPKPQLLKDALVNLEGTVSVALERLTPSPSTRKRKSSPSVRNKASPNKKPRSNVRVTPSVRLSPRARPTRSPKKAATSVAANRVEEPSIYDFSSQASPNKIQSPVKNQRAAKKIAIKETTAPTRKRSRTSDVIDSSTAKPKFETRESPVSKEQLRSRSSRIAMSQLTATETTKSLESPKKRKANRTSSVPSTTKSDSPFLDSLQTKRGRSSKDISSSRPKSAITKKGKKQVKVSVKSVLQADRTTTQTRTTPNSAFQAEERSLPGESPRNTRNRTTVTKQSETPTRKAGSQLETIPPKTNTRKIKPKEIPSQKIVVSEPDESPARKKNFRKVISEPTESPTRKRNFRKVISEPEVSSSRRKTAATPVSASENRNSPEKRRSTSSLRKSAVVSSPLTVSTQSKRMASAIATLNLLTKAPSKK